MTCIRFGGRVTLGFAALTANLHSQRICQRYAVQIHLAPRADALANPV